MSRVVIHDACILIDLSDGQLLEDYLRLGYETVTTDLVVAEIRKDSPETAEWLEAHVEIFTYDDDGMLALVSRKKDQSARLSWADASVLFLAEDRQAHLLTNDGRLRKSAEALRIKVNGVFMVMDSLFERRITSGSRLCNALNLMINNGSRLPPNECSLRLKKWTDAD